MGDPFLDDAPRPRSRYVVGAAAVVLVVALVVGVVGIFTVGKHQRSARQTASRGASEQLATRLLAPADLPPGWTLFGSTTDAAAGADGFGGSSSVVPGCLSGSVDSQRTAEAEEQLAMGNSPPPSINEAVAAFSGSGSTSAFVSVRREINACQRVIISGPASGGGQATISPVSVPPLGNQTAAWAITLPTKGRAEATTVVAVRQGSTLVLMAYATAGSPNVTQAVAFSRVALDKLAGTAAR